MNKLIFEKINTALLQNSKTVIAIDGMCASGKSTLAAEIQQAFGGTVIHADDFFLPVEMRKPERLNEPGGNFHRERFGDEVIKNLDKCSFSYGVFDCAKGEITKNQTVNENRLIIIEGSYCMHPENKADYDLKIFICTDENTQRQRIFSRNGENVLSVFVNKWIPMENKYFDFFGIKEKCDAVIYS